MLIQNKTSKGFLKVHFSRTLKILNDEKSSLLVLDNAKIHKATDVEIACEILNIELMFLPKYSPDCNPIEDLWKIKINTLFK